ncbi:hypothetical protein [Pseudoneobacillus sp. C159]
MDSLLRLIHEPIERSALSDRLSEEVEKSVKEERSRRPIFRRRGEIGKRGAHSVTDFQKK